ncbi:MAG: hypothetical protein E7005_01890 [Alphaproteobacteria bacterium]|nr:hypothetical protein [Alphaproteobacteria bacterium]
MRDDLKKSMKKDFDEATERMRNVDFQVDTLANNTGTGGYFNPANNSITINYLENDEDFNKWSGSGAVLIHEQKHRDNANQGIHAYAMSVEQAYKVCMHDEISANMAGLIYLRDKYLKTGDISVFEEDKSNFDFYIDAIKNGEINPFSNSKEDFDKEMALIVNGTRDMWVKTYASNFYLDDHIINAKYYGEEDGKNAEFYDENYERAKKIAYNIGGIDFTKYMDKDVEVPEQGKLKILSGEKWAEALEIPEYDGKMSLLQYQKLLQHALVMKDSKVGINSKDYVSSESESTKGKLILDMAAYYYLTEGKLDDSTQENYKEALDNIAQEDKKVIEDVITNIAKDYEKRGEKLPEGDDKAYNDAVDKIYTGTVKFNEDDLKYEGEINLRKAFNPNDELPLKELPQKAQEAQQKLEDMGMWGRGVKQYGNFFLGDELDYDKAANMPYGLRYPVEVLGVGIGAPILAVGKKCMEFGSDCVDAVKSWLGNENSENLRGHDNQPIHDISKGVPQYHEWSKEKRVSPVQNAQILNLMADVIEKPTNRDKPDVLIGKKDREILKKDMQNEAKEKARMLKVIEGMNRINGAKNAMEVGRTINTLYDKFGDNAYELLAKAVNEPFNFAQDIGDSTIRTSRDAVRSLCNTDDKNKNAVINSVLRIKER